MTIQKTGLAVLGLTAAAMVGCGGGGGGGGSSDPTPTPTPTPTATPGAGDSVCDESFVSCSGTNATLSGTIDKDFTLSTDFNWFLDGFVQVGNGNVEITSNAQANDLRNNGVELTIPAGTHVKALETGVLIVTRGNRLIANGTATNPITFSSVDDGFDGLGEWGGVVLQGFAPQFGAGGTGNCFGDNNYCNVAGEGGSDVAFYGGKYPADNSGSIRYVRIAEGGLVAGPNNEVNGLTLQGVGHATTIEYVQVHNNLDDGVEWFGGTVNAKYLVLTGNDDDDIDYDEGYKGNIQFAIVKKSSNDAPQGSNDPRGIEANSSDEDFVPQTTASLANILLIGNTVSANEPGMRLRGALTTSIFNTALVGWDKGCIRIDDADTNADDVADQFSNVSLENVFGDCAGGFYTHEDADSTAGGVGSQTISLDDAYAINEGFASLASATNIVAVDNGSGFAFETTDYVGAVEPGTSMGDAWWAGWTIPGSLSDADEAPASASFVSCNDSTMICEVTGTIDEDYTFVAGYTWVLNGLVKVGDGNVEINSESQADQIKADGVTLTIRPGVDVKGTETGVLVVTRGSKLIANGSASAPITFSSLDENFDGLGEWGGVVMQGFAPQFGAGNTGNCHGANSYCNVAGEGGGGVAFYGGDDPADNSGSLRYVRIAEGGLVAGPNNEVNGLTLQGVGYMTSLDYIQVHNNLDDGVEWFGGTVNAKHLVLTGNDDDDIDFDEGYKGNIQYAIVIKSDNATPQGSNDPRGIEANSSDEDYVPQTQATLANILLVGNTVSANEPGMRLRGALTVSIFNTALTGWDEGCIRIDDADTNGDDTNDAFSDVTLVNILGNCSGGLYTHRDADSQTNYVSNAVNLNQALVVTGAAAQVSAPSITAVANGSGFSFDETNYIGAVAPGTNVADAWWNGWTIPNSVSVD